MNYTELSFKELRTVSIEAANKIKKNEDIDLIIYVAKAGLPIAVYMNEVFGVSLLGVGAQRKGNKVKSIIGPLVAYCPRIFRDMLITIELNSKVHTKNKERYVEFHKSIEQLQKDKFHKILLVDDSVDTGISMKIVCDSIRKIFNNADVVSYSLNVWKKSKAVFETNYSSYEDTVIRTPMSKDSREYKIFCKMYDKESKNNYI